MRCVVIGGSGFLGGAIVRELVGRGSEVLVADRSGGAPHDCPPGVRSVVCDITNPVAVRRTVQDADEVYLIAGVLGTSGLNGDIQRAVQVNIAGAVNVLQACLEAGVPRVFYPGKPNCWLNTYTVTKEAAERFAALFNEADLEVVRMRWFNAYGPGQHMAPVRKIVPTFCLCARFELPLPIYGTGLNTVDMIFSDDLARWSVEATRRRFSDRVYDLGTGEAMTVREVAEGVREVSGTSAGLRYEPMRQGETEPTELVADVEPLRARLWTQHRVRLRFTAWEEGLERTWRYYRDVPENRALEALEHHGLLE